MFFVAVKKPPFSLPPKYEISLIAADTDSEHGFIAPKLGKSQIFCKKSNEYLLLRKKFVHILFFCMQWNGNKEVRFFSERSAGRLGKSGFDL